MIKMTQKQLRVWTPPLGSAIISDLDGCAIDSSHRQHCLPNGQLDLDDWRDSCSEPDIKLDVLTPWGFRLAELSKRKDLLIGACTSRVLNRFDYNYITEHLHIPKNCGMIWSRPETCRLNDADLKLKLLTEERHIFSNIDLMLALNLGKLFFVDDLLANCQVAENLGLQAIHVVKGINNII